MQSAETNGDAEALALAALVWTLEVPARAERLLAVTGLEAGDLRARAGERTLLAAILGFLEAYEPDLLACAAAIGATPAELVRAREALEG
jgi:hypothetical protein